MKNLLTILLSIFCWTLIAQAPQQFNFQAIARDNGTGGGTLGNTTLPTISVGISQNSNGTSAIYSENFTNVKTSPWGLFSLSIGTGSVAFGTFNTINWGSGPWYLRVQIGSPINFDVTTQLLSVPYALYAEKTRERDIAIFEERKDPLEKYPTGTSTSKYVTRRLNFVAKSSPTISLNTDTWEITFSQPGSYLIDASAPAYRTSLHRLTLRAVSNNAELLVGSTQITASGGDYATNSSLLKGVINVPSAGYKINLQHYIYFKSVASELGTASLSTESTYEVYARMMIEKLN